MILAFLAIRIFFCFRQTCCAESFLYHKKKLYIKPTYHKWTYTRLDWRFRLVLVRSARLLFSLVIIRIIIVGNYQYSWCRRLYEWELILMTPRRTILVFVFEGDPRARLILVHDSITYSAHPGSRHPLPITSAREKALDFKFCSLSSPRCRLIRHRHWAEPPN